MKRNTIKNIFLALTIACIILFLILPRLGRPTRAGVKYQRVEQLKNWRQATICYIQQHEEFPKDLYDVYQYTEEAKLNLSLSFLVWISRDKEESLIHDSKLFENRDVFNEKIEYELILKEGKWIIQEKNNYPYFLFDREMKRYWSIDQDGNISYRK